MTSDFSPLWDRTEETMKHLQEGYWQSDMQCKFTLDVCRVLDTAHKELKKLTVRYQKTVAQRVYPPGQGSIFASILSNVELTDTLSARLQLLHAEFKQQVTELRTECELLQKQLQERRQELLAAEETLRQSKQRGQEALCRYQEQYKEMLRAQENTRRADENMKLSRKEVDQFHQVSKHRTQECEAAEKEYVGLVAEFNQQQTAHTTEWLSSWVEQCKTIHDRRCAAQLTFTEKHALSIASMREQLDDTVKNLASARGSCDIHKDWCHFINNVTTGNSPPSDMVPVDLSAPAPLPSLRKPSLPSTMRSGPLAQSSQSLTTERLASDGIADTSRGSGLIAKLFRRTTSSSARSTSVVSMCPATDDATNPNQGRSKLISKPIIVLGKSETSCNEEHHYASMPPKSASCSSISSDDNFSLHEEQTQSSPHTQISNPKSEDNLDKHSARSTSICTALYQLDADPAHGILGMEVGEKFVVVQKYFTSDWHRATSYDGSVEGLIPASYVEFED